MKITAKITRTYHFDNRYIRLVKDEEVSETDYNCFKPEAKEKYFNVVDDEKPAKTTTKKSTKKEKETE